VRILVADGDGPAAEYLLSLLARHGHVTDRVGTARAALTAHREADLVVLSVELPDADGVKACRTIRAASDVPIIALTAGSGELDRVLILQAGADDCMVKPYGFRELLARIDSVMRRARPRPPGHHTITHGPLIIDPGSRQVAVQDRVVKVTRKEFNLLHLLAARPQTVVSRNEIMTVVWNDELAESARTIDTHVSALRRKLGDGNLIQTVRGIGYRIGNSSPRSLPAGSAARD
jgi:DNA-binding response OmpR family regulator